ncbi:phage tail domain-containing protein [Proteiniborus sp. MB09-C3]|uniref:phage tail domain-containing protein n=1 Tax=Proteiniborus sp. MB09-C3 TaxID=3050072 RepID=UPI0025526E83|nr:phage tail domain-containing protein [Proteiniborus sp. MB09-C3]WIV10546.1 phage tail family protein [Proteiniborus sp. MB09-C3]
MESPYFIFDGIKSSDMGLYIIELEPGRSLTPYWGSQSVIERNSRRKITTNLIGINRYPIEFNVKFSLLKNQWTTQKRNEIARWLLHDTYKEFQTCDDLGKYFYAICNSSSDLNLIHNRGYFELTFRTNSQFAWSPIYISEFDLSDNVSTKIIEVENKSNVVKYFYPKLQFSLKNNTTNFSIRNLSNGGKVFSFENLNPNETVGVDNEEKIVLSDNPMSNPFSKFNRNWLALVQGVNYLEITGQCDLKFKQRFPIAQ